ncbi:MAG: SUMF1/EgtB/PvdO family nonheme iron enzyme [Planctomycetaceae bacterium]|nr:SUMF1/EgtB/PvdO family nonheme iron enzyme [Planctomycetaceae bacterium]
MSQDSRSKSLVRELAEMCDAREDRWLITLSDREIVEEFCKFDMSDKQKAAKWELTCRLWERQGTHIRFCCGDEDERIREFFNTFFTRVAENLEGWLEKQDEEFQDFTFRWAGNVDKSLWRFARRLQTGDTKLSRDEFFGLRFSKWRSHSQVYSATELTAESEGIRQVNLNLVPDAVDLPVPEQVEQKELDDQLRRSIEKLPEYSHDVLQLRFHHHLSFDCISEALGQTPAWVTYWYNRGLNFLKRDLAEAGFKTLTVAAIMSRLQGTAEASSNTGTSMGGSVSGNTALATTCSNAAMISKAGVLGFAVQTIAAGSLATVGALCVIAMTAPNRAPVQAPSDTIVLAAPSTPLAIPEPAPARALARQTEPQVTEPASVGPQTMSVAALRKEPEAASTALSDTALSSGESQSVAAGVSEPKPPVQAGVAVIAERDAQPVMPADLPPMVQTSDEVKNSEIPGGFALYPQGGRIHRLRLDDRTSIEFAYCPEASDVTGFWMTRTEVTQAQWDFAAAHGALKANPSYWNGPSLPVERITPLLAEEFCRAFSREVGIPVRLPTETEWNHAVAAGQHLSEKSMLFNDEFPKAADVVAYAWIGANSRGKTHPVGQLKPNAWNLQDLFGNVFEIVRGDGDEYRVAGGSWSSKPVWCKEGYLSDWPKNRTDEGTGFRVVIDAKKSVK